MADRIPAHRKFQVLLRDLHQAVITIELATGAAVRRVRGRAACSTDETAGEAIRIRLEDEPGNPEFLIPVSLLDRFRKDERPGSDYCLRLDVGAAGASRAESG